MNVKRTFVYGLLSLGFAALVAAFVVSLASGADALSITNSAGTAGTLPTLGNTSTGNFLDDGGSDQSQGSSTLTLPTSDLGPKTDTVGNSVSFTSRYGLLLAADMKGDEPAVNFTSTYTISFKVNVGAGKSWVLEIDTSRLGALTRVPGDDPVTGKANIGAITGTLKADGVAKVDNFDFAAVNLPAGSTAANTAISQSSSTLSYGFIGSHTFDLSFTWLSSATSDGAGTAIRLGINGGLTSTTADNYPGVGSRTEANDGHFVDITAEIPFPATLSLLVAGAMLSCGVAWRKRRRGEPVSQLTPGGDSETPQS